MELAYKRAFMDVLYLTKQIDSRLANKILDSFIDFMKENCDKNYKPTNISINEPDNLSEETKTILSLVYRSYLVQDKKNTEVHIETSIQRAKYDKILAEQPVASEDQSLVIQTKSNNFFRKICNFIKHLFKRGGTK